MQSIYIWYGIIRYLLVSKKVRGDRQVMIDALTQTDIREVRRVLMSYTHLEPLASRTAAGRAASESDGLFDDVWTEVYEHLTKPCSGLATIASTAPFVGLFGTVWGILVAFSSIRSAEAISFSALAPSIGEALFATMAGLFVAIPAVMSNNWISSRSVILSRQCAQAYIGLVGELTRLARKPAEAKW